MNSDIFGRGQSSSQIFYICHKDGSPILEQLSKDEKEKRNERYDKLIDFVKRRDLNKQFIYTYEEKKKEFWKFVNSDSNSSREISVIDLDED